MRAPTFRSWLICVSALSALAFGTRAEADIILLLSETTYAVGQPVEFALVNASEHIIAVPQRTWWRITDSHGAVVDGCEGDPHEVEVVPGNYLTASWDQIDCAHQMPVSQGRFRVEAVYESECCPGFATVEAYFEIGNAAAVAPTSWGRIKAAFEGNPTLPRKGR